MGMIQDLVYMGCQYGFFPQANIIDNLKEHISRFCQICDSAIIYKYNKGIEDYNKAMKELKLVENMVVLKGLCSNKVPTNHKFCRSTSESSANT